MEIRATVHNNSKLLSVSVLHEYLVKSSFIRLGILFFLLILAAAERFNLSDPEFRFRIMQEELYIIFFVFGFSLSLSYLIFNKYFVKSFLFFKLQFFLDIFLLTFWVFISGGIFSGFLFIYILCLFFYGKVLGLKYSILTAVFLCCILFAISCFQFYFPEYWGSSHIRGSDIAYNYSLFVIAVSLVSLLVFVGKKEEKRLYHIVLRHESSLRRAEELKRKIFDWIESGIISVDNNGIITSINSHALKWIPASEYNIIYSTFFGEYFPEFISAWEKRRENKKSRSIIYNKDRDITFGFKINELPDDKGWLILFSDITDVQKLEKRVQEMEKMATIGELAAGLAHEMKNPLAGIKTSIQLLLSDDIGKEYQERLSAVILRDIDRLDVLLKDFLFFARPTPATREWFFYKEEIENIIIPLKMQFSSVEIHVDLQNRQVFFDKNQFHQIFLNLCLNAFQALEDKEHPVLEIIDIFEDSLVKIVVSDNGPGMHKEILKKCFDPFVTTKAVGSGLGLSIASRLSTQNGAFLEVRSEEGKGTQFYVIQDIELANTGDMLVKKQGENAE